MAIEYQLYLTSDTPTAATLELIEAALAAPRSSDEPTDFVMSATPFDGMGQGIIEEWLGMLPTASINIRVQAHDTTAATMNLLRQLSSLLPKFAGDVALINNHERAWLVRRSGVTLVKRALPPRFLASLVGPFTIADLPSVASPCAEGAPRAQPTVPVVELLSVAPSGSTTLMARFVLATDGTVAIVAATDHLAQVTERTAGRLPGPGNTWVTRAAGRAFLDLLPVNFRGTHLFATQVFVMDLDAAMHAGTSPTQDAP